MGIAVICIDDYHTSINRSNHKSLNLYVCDDTTAIAMGISLSTISQDQSWQQDHVIDSTSMLQASLSI